MISHVSHITLFVSDQDQSLAFYSKCGFMVHSDAMFGPMRWLTLSLPSNKNFELVLMATENAQEKALIGKQAAEKPLFTLATTDCFADCQKLEKEGVVFVAKPEKQPWGIAAMCKDPDGNLVYICQETAH